MVYRLTEKSPRRSSNLWIQEPHSFPGTERDAFERRQNACVNLEDLVRLASWMVAFTHTGTSGKSSHSGIPRAAKGSLKIYFSGW